MLDWHHAPPHRALEKGAYMITGGTLHKCHYFDTPDKLSPVVDAMFDAEKSSGAKIEAWAVMSNHYHLIVNFDEENVLPSFISKIHGMSAIKLNKADNISGRKVWHNYWDSRITYQDSYFARLNYVNKNPEHHEIVDKAENYRWCSEAWYKFNLDPAFAKTVASFKFDKLKVKDDF